MNKDRISVALNKNLITKLNEESKKARRSRSNLVELILERELSKQPKPSNLHTENEEEITFKMG